jgi:serine protease inhibitor
MNDEDRDLQENVSRLIRAAMGPETRPDSVVREKTFHALASELRAGRAATGEDQSNVSPKVPTALRRYLMSAFAAAACLVAGVSIWLASRGHNPNRPDVAKKPTDERPIPEVTLAAGWRVAPTGAADYRIVAADRISLLNGELFVESTALEMGGTKRPPLHIETSAGTATAAGTSFYIGSHTAESNTPNATNVKGAVMSPFTRVLVLAGMVTLANSQGSIAGQANQLLAAEPDKAPVNLAITANSDFALDLYGQLAKEHKGKNLFFSPYSMSSALAMVAEGARGETAQQMAKVLRFPDAARRLGDDAQLIPWNVALIHTGMAELNERFNAAQSPPKELLDKLDAVGKACEAAEVRAQALSESPQRGDKEKEIEAAWQKAADLRNEVGGLIEQIDQYELRVANSLWGDKKFPFKQSYVDAIHKFYRTGGLFSVDFQGDYGSAVKRINAWVAEQTHGRIQNVISPDGQPAAPTALVLTNAVYFKGGWHEIFDDHHTKPDNFTLAHGAKVQTPMMHAYERRSDSYAAFNQDGSFFATPEKYLPGKTSEAKLYPGDRGFAMLEMTYKGEELSMVLIVPRSAKDFASLEEMLTSKNLQSWIARLASRETEVFMPKFQLRTEYNMGKPLEDMGMSRALAPGADFSGIGEAPLYLGKVLHKACVDVNEIGTEAGAATFGMAFGGVEVGEIPFRPTFRADKPFVFLIRDRKTGSILFLGRVMDPRG